MISPLAASGPASGAIGIACDAETAARPSPSAKTDAAANFMDVPSLVGGGESYCGQRDCGKAATSVPLTSNGGASDGDASGGASPNGGGASPNGDGANPSGGGASPSACDGSPNGGRVPSALLPVSGDRLHRPT